METGFFRPSPAAASTHFTTPQGTGQAVWRMFSEAHL
jgi:hypothetical protein